MGKIMASTYSAAAAACTCHPDDKRNMPCQQLYAFTQCREAYAASLVRKKGMSDVVDWIRWFVKNVSDPEDFRWKAMTAAADRIEELEDEVYWLKDDLEKAQMELRDERS